MSVHAYLDAKYESFPNAPCPISSTLADAEPPCHASGKSLPRAPEFSGSLIADLDYRVAPGLRFLAGLNLFLLVVGCIMDIFSAVIIVVPIMIPVALTYGVDPFHLCVIFLVNLEIGYSTPPIGMNLFIGSLKFLRPITALYRASVPYLLLMLLVLVLVTYVPVISLFMIR